MEMIEKIMNIWAKITSLVIIGGLIYWIYLTIQIFFLSIRTPIWIYSMPFWWISGLIFYSPLFYYGWVKKPKNELMKFWAKVLTIIFPVFAVLGFISPWGLNFPRDILFIIPAFILIGPLYYYAWRD